MMTIVNEIRPCQFLFRSLINKYIDYLWRTEKAYNSSVRNVQFILATYEESLLVKLKIFRFPQRDVRNVDSMIKLPAVTPFISL